jgi:hypothetical protein
VTPLNYNIIIIGLINKERVMRVTGGHQNVINTLQKSETGRKLLSEAEKRGVKIEFKPNNGDNVNGQYNPNNNTITVDSNNLETMVETLGHELVHATTRENGNSKNEELSAFLIGEKIAKEAGVDANPHHADFWKNHVANSYKDLKQDNGIMGSLNALGIAAQGNNPATAGANTPIAGNIPNLSQLANYGAQAANPQTAAQNPFQAAQNAAQQTAPELQNPMNGQQNAGMFMQLIQMIMQMFMQMFAQMGQQQNQQNNPANPLNPTANNNQANQTNPLAPQAQPAQQQQPRMVFMAFNMQG